MLVFVFCVLHHPSLDSSSDRQNCQISSLNTVHCVGNLAWLQICQMASVRVSSVSAFEFCSLYQQKHVPRFTNSLFGCRLTYVRNVYNPVFSGVLQWLRRKKRQIWLVNNKGHAMTTSSGPSWKLETLLNKHANSFTSTVKTSLFWTIVWLLPFNGTYMYAYINSIYCLAYQYFYYRTSIFSLCIPCVEGGSLTWCWCGSAEGQGLRYFTHARLLDNGRLWDNDKMFISKAFTPLQAPGCLTLAEIDS